MSLGPKPTAKQMETLKKLCGVGVEIHWYSGIRSPDSADIVSSLLGTRETIRIDTMRKFASWGWIEAFSNPALRWRNCEYRITEKGRKVVELGIVRK
jgi:hypothetical protein